jgi:hypothetical protein
MPMVFPTSPTVGQVFSSGGRSWVWTGSTWDSPSSATAALSGLTLITNQSFTSQTTVNIDNVFSADYDYYKVYARITGTSTAGINSQLRASGSALTGNYAFQRLILVNSTFFNSYISTQSSLSIGDSGNGQAIFVEMSIAKPFQPVRTNFIVSSQTLRSGVSMEQYVGVYEPTTSATGFNIVCGSAISGDVRVYGMRN